MFLHIKRFTKVCNKDLHIMSGIILPVVPWEVTRDVLESLLPSTPTRNLFSVMSLLHRPPYLSINPSRLHCYSCRVTSQYSSEGFYLPWTPDLGSHWPSHPKPLTLCTRVRLQVTFQETEGFGILGRHLVVIVSFQNRWKGQSQGRNNLLSVPRTGR